MTPDMLYRHIQGLKRVLNELEVSIIEINEEIYKLENAMYDMEENAYEYR